MTTEKGKPGVSRGRKARGLNPLLEIARLPVTSIWKVCHVRKYLFSRSAVSASFVTALLAFLIPGQASAALPTQPSSCPTPAVSQPFLSWGDSALYTPAPGVTPDSFTAAGWTLTGGARVVSTTLADGHTGLVLDLPPGSSATSPTVCVDSTEPTASMITQAVGTGAFANAATFYVTPVGSSLLTGGQPVGAGTQWSESRPANVFRGVGSENATLTLVSNEKTGDVQVYNLFIDPHMRG